jgi:hypothetical protein
MKGALKMEKYEVAQMEIVSFENEDIITDSNTTSDDTF